MAFKVFNYEGGAMTVHYESKRCIHAKECVRGLPGVFDPKKRPWVTPDAASADVVAPKIRQGEASSPDLVVTVRPDGPLIAEGPVVVRGERGGEHRGTNCALCRCGASDAKPFCDGSHKSAGFQAA